MQLKETFEELWGNNIIPIVNENDVVSDRELKFSDNDTPIEVEIAKVEAQCEIRIKDYGIGIPEHLREMLFDQFSKAGRSGLNGEKSIGLGLHISKDIVEQHGGTLTLETEENKGSTFIISMPLAS